MKEWLVGRQDWTARTKNELRVGGRYHHEMIVGGTAGNKTSDGCNPGVEFEPGAALLHEGEYLEISPPERLVFTWNSPSVKNTRVTVELRDLGDSTELWLTHELLETEDLRRSHTGGWNTCLEKLEHFLTA